MNNQIISTGVLSAMVTVLFSCAIGAEQPHWSRCRLSAGTTGP